VRRLGVASNAGSIRVVGGINVAVGADGVVVRELPEIIVVEGGAEPASGVVAAGGGAGGGETSSDVVGNRAAEGYGALPGGDVATVAVGGQVSGIIVVDVAG